MDGIRLAARSSIEAANSEDLGELAYSETDSISLHALWADVSSHRTQEATAVNEGLLVIRHVLKNRHKDKNSKLPAKLKAQQSTFNLAISCIKYLNDVLPVLEASNSVDILMSLSSFTSLHDPWTTSTSVNDALAVLELCMQPERRSRCWPILERICESNIKPIFAKTKNAAITATGRKNLHPLPRQRFDDSLFDPESKPWKHKDVYATTVLEWILRQYNSSDINRLENQFHFYVPPILSLIDDESASFKYRGCMLLASFLAPIRTSNSDLLRRTNLSSVFDDALTPCLLSLPSITPEEEALQLLGSAYPALLLTLQARYHVSRTQKNSDDKTAYITRLITLLRDSVISSFHHISSYSPASAIEGGSSLASFPYLRLSTFLLEQLRILVKEIGIHTTKYLQEIIPVLYTTLTNPFGTASVPLLLAGVAAAQAVILNAYPRIWRYRGDFLAAVCQCWINVLQDELGTSYGDDAQKDQLRTVKCKLQGTVYLLKMGVQGAVTMKSEGVMGADGEENLDTENDVKALVEADEQLKPLLQIDVDRDLGNAYFFD
ncbi:hypothetical protein UA08_06966 [Talaromyces atroroseus]|uniref:Uncharacterized protein n=1 Tax=Talaromyces atroroseus TaxID=1441469 RepID=A0A225AKP9_TALAT|nr:hypothetical protein UA08_06966 [Talaromyces atroroseus]OKL57808.1 hypothetical protein UA08_06966 [Talaromyces atroroseus]